MLILHITLISQLGYKPNFDAKYVDEAARNYAINGNFSQINKKSYYFPSYPNNWALLLLASWTYRGAYLIFEYVPDLVPQIISTLCIHISGILMFFTARLIFKDKIKPLFCSVLFLTNWGLYTNAPVLYSDTLSMPFVIGGIYLFLKAMKSEKTSQFVKYMIFSAITVAFGNSFKGSVAVMVVAFILYSFMKVGWKKCLCVTASLIIAVPSVSFAVKAIGMSSGIADKELLNAKQLPVTHWINMSLVGYGEYNREDRLWIEQFPTYDEKNEACIKSIKQRLSDYSFSDFALHTARKIVKTWTDGKYHTSFLRKSDNRQLSYFMTKGFTARTYGAAAQIMLMTFMLMSFIYGAVNSKNRTISLIRLTVFGFALFFIIWEIKSRYLVNFLPLMFVMAVDGLNYSYALIQKISRRKTAKSKLQTA
ncbi:MAG: glycosyltransferase family 39 protein [Hominimerdicola sp.]